jgi:hypothetical protein
VSAEGLLSFIIGARRTGWRPPAIKNSKEQDSNKADQFFKF